MVKSDNDEEYKQNKAESSEEEFVEEATEEKPAKKQKTEKVGEKRKRNVTSDAQENKTFELSAKRKVTVRLFSNGEPSVDIREFYKDKASGEMRPGKSGICFPLAQWNKLKELMSDIDEAVESIKKD
ncbi:unnamed protein product [Rhizopus stolonifer]